jgi:hypothetical protein
MKHKCLLIILPVMLLCLYACKKDAANIPSKITVVGKWQMTKHDLKLVQNGVQIGETIRTSYTKYDFTQYFSDGTGYQSAQGAKDAPSLNTFQYTLKDNVITQYINGSAGIEETITKLTETEFAIHYESQVPDPAHGGQFNTEIDDYSFTRVNL